MRNYIILNGNNSNLIDGLLIQSLPPITMPMIRANIEEIDGRNGDIVTPLGFSAYDKQITIGLYGDYDVDEVIKYFFNNYTGQVIFSNEPDKYYNYTILEQIDFEKLIRFKTAVVTLHCQPFKYPTVDTPKSISNQDTTITNEGNIFSQPIITLDGTGTISIYIDNHQVFSVELDNEECVIDTERMETYNPRAGQLMNRKTTGDFGSLMLGTGEHQIRASGYLASATISNYTRWL